MSATLRPTPGQTVGPFFRYGLEFDDGERLVPVGSPGSIRLHGHVFDGAGDPVPDALVEIWQADASGAVPREDGSFRRDGTFTGWGRVHTGEDGSYEFSTVEPGAGFIAVAVFARGLLDRLHTRIYLPQRPEDAFLASLTPDERATLVATATANGYHHDFHLQGEKETVFLAFR